jgi:hypothetical protein
LPDNLRTAWLFIDDKVDEAAAFRDTLADGEFAIDVDVLGAEAGRAAILTGVSQPGGVLMDVDLSSEAGVHGTGLGIAQDIRAKQKAGSLVEFPVVRFAYLGPVQLNVGGDPASDDLFDDKIQKNEVGDNLVGVQKRLRRANTVYRALVAIPAEDRAGGILRFLGLDEQAQADWAHPELLARLEAGLSQAAHVPAGIYLRTCLSQQGILIDRPMLLMRLGLSQNLTEQQWGAVEAFARPFSFGGVGAEELPRWWARGLDDVWYDIADVEDPLSMTAIEDRVRLFSAHVGLDMPPLTMPETSLGTRPWRWCALSLENEPAELVPVDPKYGVRVSPRSETPVWVDPLIASYGAASRVRDPRLNSADFARLRSEI